MAFNKKYAGLPDLVRITLSAPSSHPLTVTTTVRTASNVDDDIGYNSDIDRQGVNPDAARALFLGATVDARDVNFSDSIDIKRKSYRSKRSHRRRRHENGLEEVGDLSDSEDETLNRKLNRLRREVEELKHDMAAQLDDSQPSHVENKDSLDDGVLELSRALDTLYASSRRPASTHHSAAAVLSQRLTSDSTNAPTTTPEIPSSGQEVEGGILSHAAAFDSRLALLEAAMGISSSSNPFVTDGISEPSLQPVLPNLDHVTSRLTTLTNLLVGPAPVSAVGSVGSTPSTTISTPHLESLSARVRKLTIDTEALASARKNAVEAAKAAQNARIDAAALGLDKLHHHANASSSSSSATEVIDPTASQRDEQVTKIQALYATLPTIQSLHPILPSVLERLRSLRAIHAGAAQAAESLDVLERRQADMAGEIVQWREGLDVVERKMSEGEAALKSNVELVEPWVRDLEMRLQRLN
ncbi:uncharacterized protein ATNIH1004_002576 [Aspergillus tanneri]|uniref:Dynactin subunit 2 n=1 Tax=Aspergillus tanneri TaxID=1220188 RepID=A0A5M9N5Q4_9EURO|nr:uncharacterized protein ATNIH1004_002576 [Aspergillus tanneri]KAA8649897.1 hypothetical protein ATNIH1004_002576 [Aspergillus tanneri]